MSYELRYLQPTGKTNRIAEVDIIRGFALFGVLLVNVVAFNSLLFAQTDPMYYLTLPPGQEALIDQIGSVIIRIFAEAKFYPIFSFLFGLGFYIFMDRAEQKYQQRSYKNLGNTENQIFKPRQLFKRRCFFLLLFGIVNLVFIWYGDILHTYGILGFLLLFFIKKEPKQIKGWIVGLFTISILLYVVLGFFTELAIQMKGSEAIASSELLQMSKEVYTEGSFLSVVSFRLTQEIPMVLGNLLFWAPKILAMFLLGILSGKLKIFHDIAGNWNLIVKTAKITGGISLITTISTLFFGFQVFPLPAVVLTPLEILFGELTSIFLSIFYISAVIILIRLNKFTKLFEYLKYTGQMALTNYLVQCFVCSLVFYGYGLGYLNNMSITGGILFTILLFIIQMIYSKAWLTRHSYGPLEKLWRQLTYGNTLS